MKTRPEGHWTRHPRKATHARRKLRPAVGVRSGDLAVKLNASEVHTVRYLLGSFLHLSSRQQWRIPPSVAALADRLTAVSPTRHETSCAATRPEESEPMKNCIGTRLTALQLRWSERKVQRHAKELGGILVGSRWVFNADTIAAIAEQED